EVTNRIIEQYLRAFVHEKPATWGRYLPWAEWSYNTSSHSTTGMTPFEITFGQKPPTYPHYIAGTSTVEAVDAILSQREEVFAMLRRKLLKARSRMKTNADRHRRDQEFQVGDWVLIKLRPQRQVSVTGTTYSKLSKRYYGPF
ncbi:Retrotransposable element Tf2 155 kDa protein type 2, partial [Glycine soja]